MDSWLTSSHHFSDSSCIRILLVVGLVVTLALLVFLSMAPPAHAASIYVLQNDATGGDCTLIGAWDDLTDTCTLNADIAVATAGATGIEIIGSGITLDGNGHKITGLGATFPPPDPDPWIAEYALVLNGVSNTEIINLVVDNIDEGIVLDGGSLNLINYNEINNTTRGVIPVLSNHNEIVMNSCGNALWTCVDVVSSDSNAVSGNTLTASGEWGVRLFESNDNTISWNTISNKGTPQGRYGHRYLDLLRR